MAEGRKKMKVHSLENYKLLISIVNKNMGKHLIKSAKEAGVEGATIIGGRGTASKEMKSFLGIPSEREKEIILILLKDEIAKKTLDNIKETVCFKNPGEGIAFFIKPSFIAGVCHVCNFNKNTIIEMGEEKVKACSHELIISIVNKGKSDNVIEASKMAGASGGTILSGRGSGIHEKAKLFGIAIEPEKEIILILSNKENTKEILDSIIEEVKLNDEGNGIAFVLPVEETYGLSEI